MTSLRYGISQGMNSMTTCLVTLDGVTVQCHILDGIAPGAGDPAVVMQEDRRLVAMAGRNGDGGGPQGPICWKLDAAVTFEGYLEFDVRNQGSLTYWMLSNNPDPEVLNNEWSTWHPGPNISRDLNGYLFWSVGSPDEGAKVRVNAADGQYWAMTTWEFIGWEHPDGAINTVQSVDAEPLFFATGYNDVLSSAEGDYVRSLAWGGDTGGTHIPAMSTCVSVVRAGVYYDGADYWLPTVGGREPATAAYTPPNLPSAPAVWRLVDYYTGDNVIAEELYPSYWYYDNGRPGGRPSNPVSGAIGGWNYFLCAQGYVVTAAP